MAGSCEDYGVVDLETELDFGAFFSCEGVCVPA